MATNDDQTDKLKEVEFYAAAVSAWLNTSLEHDKSIFALSAGGIGLLLTILTTVGITSVILLILYIAAIAMFLSSLLAVLSVFRRNRTYIEKVIAGDSGSDSRLRLLERVALTAFALGAGLTATIGIVTAFDSYEAKGKQMGTLEKQQPQPSDFQARSFDGFGKLRPGGNPINPAPATSPAPASQPASPGSSPEPASGTQGSK